MNYPPTRKSDIVDAYGTVRVPDPYRWLEDLESPEVAAWVAAQNAVTFAHLETLPHRRHFQSRLTELWDYSRTSLPFVESGRLFYAKNSGLQRQAPIYCRTGFFDPPQLVLDPNLLSPDGSVSVSQFMPSPDARLIAYAISEGGADWETVRVRSIADGNDLADAVSWVRFSELSWTHDSKGFFYSRYPEPPKGKVLEAALSGHAVYYHRLGTAQSEDLLIYRRTDHPSWVVNATVSDDGRYVFIRTYRGADNNNQLHYVNLGSATQPEVSARIHAVVETIDAEYTPIGNYQTRLYLRTDKDAPRRRIIAIDLEHAEPAHGKPSSPSRPTPSKAPRSRADASCCMASSTCKAGCRCSASTAVRLEKSFCPASAPSPNCAVDPISTTCGSCSARPCRRQRCIDMTSIRTIACRSKRPIRRSTHRASRPARCSRLQKTARACRSS